MNTKLPLVSVILPCYNMEKYLVRSVGSLLANDYEAKEIILVDDGSTDSTPQLCDELAEKHEEIRVIHQINAGVSVARNKGIDEANGEYIMFVDPDDWVSKDFIGKPVHKITEKNADLVIFGYSSPWFRTPPTWDDYLPVKDYQCVSKEEVLSDALPHFFGITSERFGWWIKGDNKWHSEKDTPSIWRFIYRKKFLIENDLKFTPLKYGEDNIFIIECLTKAQSLYSINESLYMYEPLSVGATAKAVRAEEVLNTKILIIGERHRIAENVEKATGKSVLNLYAGSVAMASLQTAFGICDTHPYRKWRDFNKTIRLSDAMRCIPTPCRLGGGKTLYTSAFA